MHEWVKILKEAVATECRDAPAILALATLSRNGAPRVRSIVCRAIDDDGTIWILSDARSTKNAQIQQDQCIEAVFWLPKLRQQFRLRGEARVVDATSGRAIELWKHLSDATRAMFTWPAPGEVFAASAPFIEAVSADTPVPATFNAIALHPRVVEHLDLNPHPHQRIRWRLKHDWQPERLNP